MEIRSGISQPDLGMVKVFLDGHFLSAVQAALFFNNVRQPFVLRFRKGIQKLGAFICDGIQQFFRFYPLPCRNQLSR